MVSTRELMKKWVKLPNRKSIFSFLLCQQVNGPLWRRDWMHVMTIWTMTIRPSSLNRGLFGESTVMESTQSNVYKDRCAVLQPAGFREALYYQHLFSCFCNWHASMCPMEWTQRTIVEVAESTWRAVNLCKDTHQSWTVCPSFSPHDRTSCLLIDSLSLQTNSCQLPHSQISNVLFWGAKKNWPPIDNSSKKYQMFCLFLIISGNWWQREGITCRCNDNKLHKSIHKFSIKFR